MQITEFKSRFPLVSEKFGADNVCSLIRFSANGEPQIETVYTKMCSRVEEYLKTEKPESFKAMRRVELSAFTNFVYFFGNQDDTRRALISVKNAVDEQMWAE